MNAKELFARTDAGEIKSAGVWYCTECKYVSTSEQQAEECCRQRRCDRCGESTKGFWKTCGACQDAERARRLEARVAKAQRVPWTEWEGAVFPDGSDGFADIEGAMDFYEVDHPRDLPQPVWGSSSDALQLDAESIVEHAAEEMYEGAFERVSDAAIEKLQKVLDEWVRENGPPDGWAEDDTVVIDCEREREASPGSEPATEEKEDEVTT